MSSDNPFVTLIVYTTSAISDETVAVVGGRDSVGAAEGSIVVGAELVGAAVTGGPVIGAALVGAAVVGVSVGNELVGTSVVGDSVGDALGASLPKTVIMASSVKKQVANSLAFSCDDASSSCPKMAM